MEIEENNTAEEAARTTTTLQRYMFPFELQHFRNTSFSICGYYYTDGKLSAATMETDSVACLDVFDEEKISCYMGTVGLGLTAANVCLVLDGLLTCRLPA